MSEVFMLHAQLRLPFHSLRVFQSEQLLAYGSHSVRRMTCLALGPPGFMDTTIV